jgi:curved DNA-binding protein CbpA
MEQISLLNPYNLFGLNSKSNLKELQKSYYKMALLCHPDKGGTENDMNIIHHAYIYIKKQLENCNEEKEYEKMEEDFKNFCEKQKKKPPPFRDIWELSNEKKFHDTFNQQFMKVHHKSVETDINPFKNGYGDLMDDSEYHGKKIDYDDSVDKTPKHEFKQDLVIYKEPSPLPNTYGKYRNLKITKINDYTDGKMSDYLKSYCEPEKYDIKIKERTFDDIIKEREELFKN